MKPQVLIIEIPEGFKIVKNGFKNYGLQIKYSEDKNWFYLQDDLFQTTNESQGIMHFFY